MTSPAAAEPSKHEPSLASIGLPPTPPASSPEPSSPPTATSSRIPAARTYPFTSSGPGTSKPRQQFSRSARKRDSVLALSSIDHLSHHFTKLSFAAADQQQNAQDSATNGYGKVPLSLTIEEGDEGGSSTPSSSSSRARARVELLPPTPARPTESSISRSPFPLQPSISVEPDWHATIRDLRAVEAVLGLGERRDSEEAVQVDVLDVIKTTTASLRSVRDLVVAIPDDHLPSSAGRSSGSGLNSLGLPAMSATSPLNPASASLPHQGFSTPSRPAFSHLRPMVRAVSAGRPSSPSALDPLARIRRTTLDVLGALRLLEERYRLPDDGPRDQEVDRGASIDVTESPRASLESDRSDTSSMHDDRLVEEERGRPWEDRLGCLYQSGVTFDDSPELLSVRREVQVYLTVVNTVLFEGRGWNAADSRLSRRRQSQPRDPVDGLSMDAVSVDGSEPAAAAVGLNIWADKGKAVRLRLHALLSELLPASLVAALPFASGSLMAYTDGQLLCLAHNRAVRRSRRPFAFIPDHKIHDVLDEQQPGQIPAQSPPPGVERGPSRRQSTDTGEAGQRKAYLFRRIDNLREFAAAIKLRYLVPIVPPGTVNSQPGSVIFSAPLVAKREDGWESMLERLLCCWLDRLADERREDEEAEMRVGREID